MPAAATVRLHPSFGIHAYPSTRLTGRTIVGTLTQTHEIVACWTDVDLVCGRTVPADISAVARR
jgi:hypothetical protein